MEKNKLDKIMSKLENGRSYRKAELFEIRARQSNEEETYIVEGYATRFNEVYTLYDWGDYKVTEQIDPHAFDECDMSDVIMQYDHEGRVFARNSNKTLEVKADKKGLFIKADLSGTEEGRKLYDEIKGGYTNKMSFGFVVAEDVRTVTEDYENNITTILRTITKISKLYDVSAVSIPANDATEISARNFGEGVIKEIEAERLERTKFEKKKAECMILLS